MYKMHDFACKFSENLVKCTHGNFFVEIKKYIIKQNTQKSK